MSERPFALVGEDEEVPDFVRRAEVSHGTSDAAGKLLALVAKLVSVRSVEILAILIGAGIAAVAVWQPSVLRLSTTVAWAVLVIIPLIWRNRNGKA